MGKLMEDYQVLLTKFTAMSHDVEKTESGVRKAGQRVRKELQEIKKGSQQLRLDIMDHIRK